jgi:hypothetical protein
MSTPIEPQGGPTKRNTLAIASLILGALSVAFAQFCTVPGSISSVGCLGGILAIAAIVTGVLGIRSAQQGQGKRSAVGGIFTAAIGLLVFLAVFIPSMMTPGGLWTHVGATPTPTITPTPTMTPTPTLPPTETPVPTSTPAPQTHYGERFSITYTDEWEIYRNISEPGFENLIIEHPQGVLLQVHQQTLPEKPNLESETEAFLSNNFGSINMIAEGEIEIDGQRGLTKRFVYQDSRGQSYILLAVVANEYDLYDILVLAPSQEIFTRYQAETEAIITSIKFTTAGAPAPTATPEPTSPTSAPPTSPPPTGYQTFTGDKFTLTYPEDWREDEDFSREGICVEATNVSCFALAHPTDEEIGIQLIRYNIDQTLSAEQADQGIWAQMVAPEYDSVSLEKFEKNLEIDGRPAVKRVFHGTRGGVQEYVLYVIVTEGYDVYHFQGRTSTTEAFEQYQPIMEESIFSLRFLE